MEAQELLDTYQRGAGTDHLTGLGMVYELGRRDAAALFAASPDVPAGQSVHTHTVTLEVVDP